MSDRKILVVSKDTHNKVKDYCKKKGIIMAVFVDNLIKDAISERLHKDEQGL
jgi:hypothetical protein